MPFFLIDSRLPNQIVVFEIRYKPGYHLKVRMGIHVGPCVAGLTGTVLPSYSLIGEAVENAKLMEATGEPMKIQVTKNDFANMISFDPFINL